VQGCANCGTTMQMLEYHGHSGAYCSMSCMGEKEKGGASAKNEPLQEKVFGPETMRVSDMQQYTDAINSGTGQDLEYEDRDTEQDEEFQS